MAPPLKATIVAAIIDCTSRLMGLLKSDSATKRLRVRRTSDDAAALVVSLPTPRITTEYVVFAPTFDPWHFISHACAPARCQESRCPDSTISGVSLQMTQCCLRRDCQMRAPVNTTAERNPQTAPWALAYCHV